MGSLKEMQRWAYEIHSSFLVPGAPLRYVEIVKKIKEINFNIYGFSFLFRIPDLQDSIVNDIDRYLSTRTVPESARLDFH